MKRHKDYFVKSLFSKKALMAFGVITISMLLTSNPAYTLLIDRGGGLIYDSVLNITWLQDANYAATSGYLHSPGGRLGWNSALIWADNLTYYDPIRDIVWDDWRLPHAFPVNASNYNYNRSVDGSTDIGLNISAQDSAFPGSTASEMAYMYYNNLGNSAYAEWGLNTGPFINLQRFFYWSNTEHLYDDVACFFGFWDGYQYYSRKDDNLLYMWAVRDGDVGAPVPEPSTILLVGTSLFSMFAFGREKLFQK